MRSTPGAWNRLERLLGKARFTGPGEEPSEQDAMKIAVQAIKDVRQSKRLAAKEA